MWLHQYDKDPVKDLALCADLKTGVACDSIPMSSTNKFYLFDPQAWMNVQNYIDALIRYARDKQSAGEESFFVSSARNEDALAALYKIKNTMRLVDDSFKSRTRK